jgi:hypothetical protein
MDERQAGDDKLHDGSASWNVVNVKSPNSFVFFYIWLFLFTCRLYAFDGLLMGAMLLIWVWWCSGFLVCCVMACWWKCVSCCMVMVGGKFYTFDERRFAYLYKWNFPWMERAPIMGVKFSSNVHVWFLESVLIIVNIDD